MRFLFLHFSFQRHRKLYIFGGQRNKEYTTDFISYDVDTQNVAVVNTDNMKSEKNNVPQSGFTQRATIDCERDEIYVLSVSAGRGQTVAQSIYRTKISCFYLTSAELEQGQRTSRNKFEFVLDVLAEDE